MIGLIVAVIITGLVFWAVSALPIAQPFRTIAYALACILLVLYVAHFFGWDSGIDFAPRRHRL